MWLRRFGILLAVLCVLLAAAIGYELLRPVGSGLGRTSAKPSAEAAHGDEVQVRRDALLGSQRAKLMLATVRSRRLFRPATPLPSKAAPHRSIDRIRSLLALRAVMDIKGRPTAYIEVKGKGLLAVNEGQEIEDLFVVGQIGPRSVELDILGQRLRLEP